MSKPTNNEIQNALRVATQVELLAITSAMDILRNDPNLTADRAADLLKQIADNVASAQQRLKDFDAKQKS